MSQKPYHVDIAIQERYLKYVLHAWLEVITAHCSLRDGFKCSIASGSDYL